MMNQLFFDFEISEIGDSKHKRQNYGDPISYLVYHNGHETKFFISEINKLGPRPKTFPKDVIIERIDEEFRLLHMLLGKISACRTIFCKKEKLRQLYYRSKRFGIREGYIPKKIRLMKVNKIKIEYKSSDLKTQNILQNIEMFKKKSRSHWNILHHLFWNVKLNSYIIRNNGFHNKSGIFEIFLKKSGKSGKKNLLGYFNGM